MISLRANHATTIYFVILLLILNNYGAYSKIRFINIHCEPYAKVYVRKCRINAVNRYYNTISMTFDLTEKVDKVKISIKLFKRANGWRPFLYNFDLDVCAYFLNRRNAVAKWFFHQMQKFTNANHTCPFEGSIIVDGYYINHTTLALPFANGLYLVDHILYANGIKYGRINYTMEFS